MKMKFPIGSFGAAIFALAFSSFVACSDSKSELPQTNQNQTIGFNANVTKGASITASSQIEDMMVHSVTSSTSISDGLYPASAESVFFNNVEYVRDGSRFIPKPEDFEANPGNYFWTNNFHHFLITSPFDAVSRTSYTDNGLTLTFDMNFDDEYQRKFEDILYTKPILNKKKGDNNIEVNFLHALSKVSVAAKIDKKNSEDPRIIYIHSIKFENVARGGEINFSTATETFTPSTTTTLNYSYTPAGIGSDELNEAISSATAVTLFGDDANNSAFFLFPQEVNAKGVKLIVEYFIATEAEYAIAAEDNSIAIEELALETSTINLTTEKWVNGTPYLYTLTFGISKEITVTVEGFEDSGDVTEEDSSVGTDDFEDNTNVDDSENEPDAETGDFEGNTPNPNDDPSVGLEDLNGENVEV